MDKVVSKNYLISLLILNLVKKNISFNFSNLKKISYSASYRCLKIIIKAEIFLEHNRFEHSVL